MLLLAALLTLADPLAGAFTFVLPPLDTTTGYVDMSYLSPEPAGAHGRVTRRDGHFVDGAGRRIRFLGTNITFGDAFPPMEAAPLIAARMRKFGLNVVRFHHMDSTTAPRGIWKDAAQTALDEGQLDRLDYFIAQLKTCGIYANLNLHVSRSYTGFAWADVPQGFKYGKTVDYFHPDMIRMQHEYATALLSHKNPYTGVTYATEPAVAFIELNNENSLTGHAHDAQLLQLPPAMLQPLEQDWRAWVRARYGSLDKALAAWSQGTTAVGPEILTNAAFAAGTQGWQLEAPKPAQATMQAVPGAGPDGKPALRCTMTVPGEQPWHFQVHQVGLDLTEGGDYTVSFAARANAAPRHITVGCRVDQADWHGVGSSPGYDLTMQWQHFRFTFRAHDVVAKHTRLSFQLANQPGTVELADVSLRPGVIVDRPADATLDTLPLPIRTALPREDADWQQCVIDVELKYVRELRDHVRKTVGAQALIVDSQASYGGIAGVQREATLSDYVDMHSYWQHPSFPGRPWDADNWRISNTPLVEAADGGTLSRLAAYRVVGLPFTVSEYDHPAPSFYSAEMFPLLAAYAGLQDWDGLYQFDYGSSTQPLPPKIGGYFQSVANPAKMAFYPVAAVLLRDNAMPAAGGQLVCSVPRASIAAAMQGGGSVQDVWAKAGATPATMLGRRTALKLVDGDGPLRLSGDRVDAATQLTWMGTPREQATATIATPQVAAVIGRIGGRSVSAGPLTVALEPTERNFAAVALTALDREPLTQSAKLLLVICGAVGNQGMGWNDTLTSVRHNWGQGPTVAEPLTARIRLTGCLANAVTALDGTGSVGAKVATQVEAGTLTFRIDPTQKTVWYALTPR